MGPSWAESLLNGWKNHVACRWFSLSHRSQMYVDDRGFSFLRIRLLDLQGVTMIAHLRLGSTFIFYFLFVFMCCVLCLPTYAASARSEAVSDVTRRRIAIRATDFRRRVLKSPTRKNWWPEAEVRFFFYAYDLSPNFTTQLTLHCPLVAKMAIVPMNSWTPVSTL